MEPWMMTTIPTWMTRPRHYKGAADPNHWKLLQGRSAQHPGKTASGGYFQRG